METIVNLSTNIKEPETIELLKTSVEVTIIPEFAPVSWAVATRVVD
jgi:hypothetical protein